METDDGNYKKNRRKEHIQNETAYLNCAKNECDGNKKTKLDTIITTNLKETFECPKSQNEIHENKKEFHQFQGSKRELNDSHQMMYMHVKFVSI